MHVSGIRHLTVMLCALSVLSSADMPFARFGGMGDGIYDNAGAFQKAFSFARSNDGTAIRFSPGVYRVGGLMLSNNAIKSVLALSNTRGLTLQGDRTEIVFTTDAGGLFAEHCPALTIRGIAFDYDPLPFTQGTVRAVEGGDRLLVDVDAGFIGHDHPQHYDNAAARGSTWMMLFDDSGALITGDAPRVMKMERTPDGQFMLSLDTTGKKVIKNPRVRAGCRYVRTSRHWGHLIRFHFSDNAVLDNVTVYSASGFAGLFSYSSAMTIRGSKIMRRPGSSRIISTSADGWHFIGAKIGPRIEQCRFEHQADDAIVLSVRGSLIDTIIDDRTISLKRANPIYYADGDTIEIVDWKHDRRVEAVVAKAVPEGTFPVLSYTLTLSERLPEASKDMYRLNPQLMIFNKSQSCERSIIVSNAFISNRARGVLLHAKDVSLIYNTFSYLGGAAVAGGILMQLPFKDEVWQRDFWAYTVSDRILIENNVLDHALNWGIGWGYRGAIAFESLVTEKGPISSAITAHTITIRSNRIIEPLMQRAGISLSHVRGGIIEENVIRPSCSAQMPNMRTPGIRLSSAHDILVRNNDVTGDCVGSEFTNE